MPMTDAPLFGGEIKRIHINDNIAHGADNVLPSRKQADHLISLYWKHLESIEPLFDEVAFHHSYQLLSDGKDLYCDESVFISTLNAIFAIATQLQEHIPTQHRNEASENFFQRAWSLLRPEQALWDAPSTGTLGCIILLARYLQCTANLHQTWMTVGLAVRMAQSLGLHLLDGSSDQRDAQVGRQMWQACVGLDR